MKPIKEYLTEGIIITVLSAAIYLSAFSYEVGYAGHFSIPREFIKLNISSLLIYGASITGISFLIFQIVNLAAMLQAPFCKESESAAFVVLLRKHVVLICLPLIAWLLSGHYASEMLKIFLWNAALIMADLLVPILFMSRDMSYNESLKEWLTRMKDQDDPGLLSKLTSSTSKSLFVAWFLLFVIFLLSNLTGKGEARRKNEFLVNEQNQILLRSYGDVMILGFLDEKTLTLEPKITLLQKPDPEMSFTIRKIGPFKKQELEEANRHKDLRETAKKDLEKANQVLEATAGSGTPVGNDSLERTSNSESTID